ncbi:MAG: pyridoxal-5-phosphate-dependent protein subunit beta, partial [Oscillospiraceae bacterium]
MIDLTKNEAGLERAIDRAREKNIVIPTFAQMQDPARIPDAVKRRLTQVGLWDIDPINLFRISWHNEPREFGGQFGGPNWIEFPLALTGVPARIIALVGKWFPTGCHKVGASFGCLAPRLVTGQFDPTYHKAVWPSTGNYCRGGAYNSKLLSCDSIAILPQGMSRERFEWLETVATEVIATPGCESNVKEIFDKTHELRATRRDCMIFNQFEEMGNPLWHYHVTGSAIAEAVESIRGEHGRLAGVCFTSGSAGTMSAGDALKERWPQAKLAVGEALQCPTL